MTVSERLERHVSGFGLQVPQLVSPDSSLRQLHDRPHTYPQKGLSKICLIHRSVRTNVMRVTTPPNCMRHLNVNRARIPKIRGDHKYHLSNVYFIVYCS